MAEPTDVEIMKGRIKIMKKYAVLKGRLDKVQKQIDELRSECKHPDRKRYMGGWRCDDCGYDENWGL